MRYTEVSLDTPAEAMDVRCDELTALGVEGFVIENEADFHDFLENSRQYWDYVDESVEKAYRGVSRIKFYLTDDDAGKAVLARVTAAFPECAVSQTEDRDWENDWKSCYEPIETGKRLVVVPEWLDVPDDGRTPLRLDPGIAFGTGSHPTTKLSLAALEDYAGSGVNVLDLGCGSGILGIAAAKLGAKRVFMTDIDYVAVKTASHNAEMNGVKEKCEVCLNDLLKEKQVKGELVLANITADVLLILSRDIVNHVDKNGVMIMSGIIKGRVDEVVERYTSLGFTLEKRKDKGEWIAIAMRKI